MLPYIDTVLMDIKHTNSAKHKEFTTQPNELILENAANIGLPLPKKLVDVLIQLRQGKE